MWYWHSFTFWQHPWTFSPKAQWQLTIWRLNSKFMQYVLVLHFEQLELKSFNFSNNVLSHSHKKFHFPSSTAKLQKRVIIWNGTNVNLIPKLDIKRDKERGGGAEPTSLRWLVAISLCLVGGNCLRLKLIVYQKTGDRAHQAQTTVPKTLLKHAKKTQNSWNDTDNGIALWVENFKTVNTVHYLCSFSAY